MTEAPTPTEKSKTQRDNVKNAKSKIEKVPRGIRGEKSSKDMASSRNLVSNFYYTTIADRLRTVGLSNSSHPTDVVKPVYERSTFPLTPIYVPKWSFKKGKKYDAPGIHSEADLDVCSLNT